MCPGNATAVRFGNLLLKYEVQKEEDDERDKTHVFFRDRLVVVRSSLVAQNDDGTLG